MTVSLERGGVLKDDGVNIGRLSMTPIIDRKVVGESKKGRALIRTEPEDFSGPVRISLRKTVTADQLSQILTLANSDVKSVLLSSMCVQDD